MSRPNSGPRLVPFTNKGARNPVWHIRWYEKGQKRHHSTRISIASDPNSVAAQEYFQEWFSTNAPRPEGPSRADQFLISDALDLYGLHHARTVSAPERIGYAIDALLGFWSGNTVSDIKGPTCRSYLNHRLQQGVKDTTVRRELGTLSAAINWSGTEGYLTDVPKVWKPAPGTPKDRWLTRDEAAALIRAARQSPKARKHLSLFILIGIYTCTRKAAILGLQRSANTTGGWVDLDRRLIYRKSDSKTQTKKRQPPAPIPPRLRRFLNGGGRYLIEHNGKPLKDIKRAFATACREAGLEGVTPHTLRHTGITWIVQAGVPLWEVAGFAGCTVEEIERTYAHHAPDHLSRAVNALNRSPSVPK